MTGLLTAADIDESALIADLKVWVGIESPTPDAAAVNRMVAHVQVAAAGLGLASERIAGTMGFGDTLIVRGGARSTPERKGILVLAHLDTVHAAGTLSAELPLRREADRLYGPGVYDMKSGALMALTALGLAQAREPAGMLPVEILFVPDEEMGSKSSRPVIDALARSAGFALVMEPARDGGSIVTARKGVAMYDIAVHGRASHAGMRPGDGRSAIREAARLVLALEDMNDPDRGVTVTVGTIQGGTGRNVIPAECRMLVDVRLPDAAAADDILGRIEALGSGDPDIRLEISGGLNRPPFPPSEAGRQLFEHARQLASDLDMELKGVATGGGSDGNFTAALGVPTLDGLGADGAGAHTFKEHVLVSSLAPRTALLSNLLMTLRLG
ncbi:glutamate carboxypeptidase [Hoeflea marina]|uniref:Glutamate carboxypeptidase n=1 Tax=Hoeflea marina TaxID=274592 RepID=A0A317PCI7_9HYPH|nr:M20 family metallopeptidase [Hoeflea marina]PWV95628.1 glutamate carboxypeptidase [Hoeflea marina]